MLLTSISLKIDFERWKSEDGDEEEVRDVVNDYPDLYKNLHKEELGYIKGTLLTCALPFIVILLKLFELDPPPFVFQKITKKFI